MEAATRPRPLSTIAVDPDDPRNAKTVDLDKAIALETPSGLRSGRGLSLRLNGDPRR
jgi:hypothetical protein